ncbi:threonylcarbamoyl-AMP synthase [Candidatus Daviesbacteria bacterium]|nr:threonylcarbamoyl-AMP synthase [Candidatus Daviesbacteria bacterium]
MKALDLTFEDTDQIIKPLKVGEIGVIPTDTIYGIVGSALNPKAVERIYTLRKRGKDKPFIILISSIDDLKNFEVKLTREQKDFLEKNWPNPLSVVLSVRSDRFQFLHRGKNSLAFRMPKDEKLLELLKQTGPLVAPSANLAGLKPVETTKEAKKYFGSKVAFYLDGGKLKSKPSTIIQLYEDGTQIILRRGKSRPGIAERTGRV